MIKTEFSKVSDLYLPYPNGFDESSEDLLFLFRKLIGLVPEELRLFIIVNNEEAGKEIKALYPEREIEIILIEDFHEIWLRDIMGFNTGINRIYKPIYVPDYCDSIYTSDYLKHIEKQVNQIFHLSTGAEVIELPLVLDGGNLVTNGEIGFVTDKVRKDNPDITGYIKDILFDYLGIKISIVGSNVHDKLAHTDGYMCFLDKRRICLSQYPNIPFLRDDKSYLNTLEEILKKEILDIIPIYDRPVAEKASGSGAGSLNSARGIYVNFLLLNDTIILPEYTLPSYKLTMDYNRINKKMLQDLGYRVKTINCDNLAKMGGSLHCISFTN